MAKPHKSSPRRFAPKELSWPDFIRAAQFRYAPLETDLIRNNALLRHLRRQESVNHIPIGYNPGWTAL
jgi:hypothetical protein